MLVLGLETSGTRGSVALVDSVSRTVLGHAVHGRPNEHAERLLGLVDEALKQAQVSKSEVERIAVSVGPGSFTGVRVGLALAQGLTLGLGIVGVGVGSLRAAAAGVFGAEGSLRVVVRDARREEYFVAAYDAQGREVLAPRAAHQSTAKEEILGLLAGRDFLVVGCELVGLPFFETTETGDPDASSVALLGAGLDPAEAPLVPHYLRGPNIVRPNLPESPLHQPRE